jgi:hypothetical protein
VGLSEAQGEYLGFVDSDDAVVSTMYEHMYETAKTGDLDIVDSGIYYQAQDLAMVHTADEDTGEQDDEKRSHNIVSGGYLMTRIYRRSFWEKLGLRFREGVTLEDMESLMYLSACAGRVGNLKEICYIYRDTADSASKVTAYEAYQKNARAAMEAAYRLLCPLPCYAGIQDAVEYTIAQLYVYALTNCLMQKGIRGDGELLQRQRELRDLAGKYIKKGYGNPYIQNKLEPEDIRLLQENDRDPLRLLGMVNPAQGETNG